MTYYIKVISIIMLIFITLLFHKDLCAENTCISCHEKVTPGVVAQYRAGKMGKTELGCPTCHGIRHYKGASDAWKAEMPTPQTCAPCHRQQVEQFKQGKHSRAWQVLKTVPLPHLQDHTGFEKNYTECAGCHKIGLKTETDLTLNRYGNSSCDSCHTRHSFSKEEALDPRACQSCHLGMQSNQWDAWVSSKHGASWQIKGQQKGVLSPTCQTCHMPSGNHQIETAWGYMALKIQENDRQWMNDRITIFQALGIYDKNKSPTPEYMIYKENRIIATDEGQFKQKWEHMKNICSHCHSNSYVETHLTSAIDIIRQSDRLMAQAIDIVDNLYQKGILKYPNRGEKRADFLKIHRPGNSLHQHLLDMFYKYRAVTINSAFHSNYNYMLWYGLNPMKDTLHRIEEIADKLTFEQQRDRELRRHR